MLYINLPNVTSTHIYSPDGFYQIAPVPQGKMQIVGVNFVLSDDQLKALALHGFVLTDKSVLPFEDDAGELLVPKIHTSYEFDVK